MSSKIQALINRSELVDYVSNDDLINFASMIIQECSMIVEGAAYHKLPPAKFGELLMEEFDILK